MVAGSMGGRLAVHIDRGPETGLQAGATEERADAARIVSRIERWAARLTRHADTSELSQLNADTGDEPRVGPTLAAALEAGGIASGFTAGLADITLLDARLAAEDPGHGRDGRQTTGPAGSRHGQWRLIRDGRTTTVRRAPGLHFDLGGVGKGWIADRALALLGCWPGSIVDADGDMAVRAAPGSFWEIAIDDPRVADGDLAVLRLEASAGGLPARWGVATSGTSIHRWSTGGVVRHHLIDPRTGAPASTDVVQATIVADTALRAEALAKAAVIAGSVEGFALLERARVRGAVLLLEGGDVFALPVTLALLAA
jgi:thiamine biosynthesis lipoprotein